MLYMIIVAYFRFQHPFFVICEPIALFYFPTATHCLYGVIVAYSPLEQPLIVIWDNCGLFSFRTVTHCYMGSLWLILL